MFCKRCHKKIIKVVKDLYEVKNHCLFHNNGFTSVTTEKTELTGFSNGAKKWKSLQRK